MIDIIIIGGGPAGLSSAIYGLRANKTVLVIEKENFGGQIINTKCVENYPGLEEISGMQLSEKMFEQAKNLGMKYEYQEVIKIIKKDNYFEVITKNKTYQSKTVIVATGTNHKTLNISNEKELLGKGISYCATCDGAFFKDLKVAVVGGGNTAVMDALYLSNICQTVYLIHRREEFRSENVLVERLKQKENVIFLTNKIITKLNGKEELTSITYQDVNTKDTKELEVNGLFIAIGQVPNSQIIKDLVELEEDQSAKINDDCMSKIPGLFVAGDVRNKKIRQLTTATSDGTIAALKAIEYIEKIED